jgi:hypothetical protein
MKKFPSYCYPFIYDNIDFCIRFNYKDPETGFISNGFYLESLE